MSEIFLPRLDAARWKELSASGDDEACFDFLVTPLTEELYRRGDFDFMDELSEVQQLLLSYEYLLNQVRQGGFIQLLVNGYAGLLPDMPRWLTQIGAEAMGQLLDDVLKMYVLNIDRFPTNLSNAAFAALYTELTGFEALDRSFEQLHPEALHLMLEYSHGHMDEIGTLG